MLPHAREPSASSVIKTELWIYECELVITWLQRLYNDLLLLLPFPHLRFTVVRASASTSLTFPCNVLGQCVHHVDQYGAAITCIMQICKETPLDAIKHHSMQWNITRCNETSINAKKHRLMQRNIAPCKEISLDAVKHCLMQWNITRCSAMKQRSMQRNFNRLWPSIDRFLAKHWSIQSSIDRSFPCWSVLFSINQFFRNRPPLMNFERNGTP